MKTAVYGTSRMENERRVPIHPRHLCSIPEDVRHELYFERGYGVPFGCADEEIAALTGNILPDRRALLHTFRAHIIPKPVEKDFEEIPDGSAVWGWVHTVEHTGVVQKAIDKKLTLVAWENMYTPGRNRMHVFQRNNEMAGYCGVQHALENQGMDANYGPAIRAAVLGFGSVSRGAVYSLMSHGVHDITVFTRRPVSQVAERLPGIRYKTMTKGSDGRFHVAGPTPSPLINSLIKADIIVNGILQNPNSPCTFIYDDDIIKFRNRCLIIDISCDEGMGFSFARPTAFSRPVRKIGSLVYYSVDHTPSLLWDSASWEISAGLLPYLKDFVNEASNSVLKEATDIRQGIILNKDIISYQNRSPMFPYEIANGQGGVQEQNIG